MKYDAGMESCMPSFRGKQCILETLMQEQIELGNFLDIEF